MVAIRELKDLYERINSKYSRQSEDETGFLQLMSLQAVVPPLKTTFERYCVSSC